MIVLVQYACMLLAVLTTTCHAWTTTAATPNVGCHAAVVSSRLRLASHHWPNKRAIKSFYRTEGNPHGLSRMASSNNVDNDSMYMDYLQRKELNDMVSKCPIFQDFPREDLERCLAKMERKPLSIHEIIIKQGDSNSDDGMYFVADGIFECVDETQQSTTSNNNNNVVNVLTKGSYFGELALLFDQPRAVTVRSATDSCIVWRLSRQDFLDAVQEYPLGRTALQAMKDKYKEKSTWKTILRMKRKELVELAVSMSRPKRKNVSFHSTLSTTVAGMYLLLQIINFEPRWDDGYGRLQIFRTSPMPPQLTNAYRLVCALFALTAVTGLFRLPKNSPPIRRLAFQSMAWACINNWTANDSNLFGQPVGSKGFTFDAWSWFGRFAVLVPNIGPVVLCFEMMDLSVNGSFRGSENVPLATHRLALFLLNIAVMQITAFTALVAFQMFQSQALVIASASPVVMATAAPTGCSTLAFLCFASLLNTLKFENKISTWTASILIVLLGFLTLWDGFRFLDPHKLVAAGAKIVPSPLPVSIPVLYTGLNVATIAAAFLRKYALRKRQGNNGDMALS